MYIWDIRDRLIDVLARRDITCFYCILLADTVGTINNGIVMIINILCIVSDIDGKVLWRGYGNIEPPISVMKLATVTYLCVLSMTRMNYLGMSITE